MTTIPGRTKPDGHIFVASNDRSTDLVLPGLHVHVRPGDLHSTDLEWPPIRHSGIARTLLDNLATSRPRAGVPSRTLPYEDLSDWLAERVLINGTTLTARIAEEIADVGQGLGHPPEAIARALDLVAGIVSEVHPFDDGNGRIARIAMNAELSAAHESRVIIPIVWRDEHIANLRAMSRDGNADRYVRAINRARRWTAAMDWSDPAEARARIHATNALVPPAEADERGVQLDVGGQRRPARTSCSMLSTAAKISKAS